MCGNVTARHFENKIVYANRCQSKVPNQAADVLPDLLCPPSAACLVFITSSNRIRISEKNDKTREPLGRLAQEVGRALLQKRRCRQSNETTLQDGRFEGRGMQVERDERIRRQNEIRKVLRNALVLLHVSWNDENTHHKLGNKLNPFVRDILSVWKLGRLLKAVNVFADKLNRVDRLQKRDSECLLSQRTLLFGQRLKDSREELNQRVQG